MSLRIIFSILLCTAAIPGLFLALSCYRRRAVIGAREFALFILACSVYAFGYTGELWGERLDFMLLWSRFEYLGIAVIPTAWILFVLRYTGRKVPIGFSSALVVFSSATFAVVLTMHLHGLYYANPRLDLSGSFPTLAFDKGPWYWLFVIYIWLSLLFGEILLFRFYLKVGSFFKMQTMIAFAGAILPFVANTVYLLGLVPDHIDPTPLTMPFFALPLAISLLRFHFLDVIPVARERVIEAISDAVIVVDAEGRLLDVNPAAGEMLGIGPDKIGLILSKASHVDYGLSRLVSTQDWMEFTIDPPPSARAEGQSARHFRARACPIAAGKDQDLGTVILVSDTTETSRLVARLDELAHTDGLTGLANRRGFLDLARHEFEVARRARRFISFCLVDLDHFKNVNDSLGHDAGDAVLKEVADRFIALLRSSDLVCRWGGEEFAMLFMECDEGASLGAAERLREGLAGKPFVFEGRQMGLSASFGLAGGIPAAEDGLDTWIRRADEALYRAKAAGRNRVVASSPPEA